MHLYVPANINVCTIHVYSYDQIIRIWSDHISIILVWWLQNVAGEAILSIWTINYFSNKFQFSKEHTALSLGQKLYHFVFKKHVFKIK